MDDITIPRTFSGQIGVADTLPSVRRSHIELYTGGLTTGLLWPGVNAAGQHTTTIVPVNGMPFFKRNFQVERGYIASWSSTSDAATTVHRIDVMGGGTTIVRLGGRLWNGTTTGLAFQNSTTPMNPNVGATTPMRIVCTRKINAANRATIVIVGQERLD